MMYSAASLVGAEYVFNREGETVSLPPLLGCVKTNENPGYIPHILTPPTRSCAAGGPTAINTFHRVRVQQVVVRAERAAAFPEETSTALQDETGHVSPPTECALF